MGRGGLNHRLGDEPEASQPLGRPPVGIGLRRLAHQDFAAGTKEADGAFCGHGGRAEGAHGHDVEGFPSIRIPGRVLGPRAHDLRSPREPESFARGAEEVATPLGRIEQHTDNVGAVGQDHEPREATAGSEVEEPDVARECAHERTRVVELRCDGTRPEESDGPRVGQDGFDAPGRGGAVVLGHGRAVRRGG